MGLLGSLLGAATGKGGGGALLTQILGHLAGGSNTGGGMPGLPNIDLGSIISKFQKGGMGDLAGSWIGMGQNQPLSPDQVTQAFGQDQLKDLAAKLGLPQSQITDILSKHLPKVVDKMTPTGKLPEGDVSHQLDELMKNTKMDDLDALIAEYENKAARSQ